MNKLSGSRIFRAQEYLKALVRESLREGIYAEEISMLDMDVFLRSAQLHDAARIAAKDTVVLKPANFTSRKHNVLRTHVPFGRDNIIDNVMRESDEHALFHYAWLIMGTHHEKWDGSGYPLGLKGYEIPVEGRLMAIADVYDALISESPKRPSFTHEEAGEIIENGAGTHFDPVLVGVFKNVKQEFKKISMKQILYSVC